MKKKSLGVAIIIAVILAIALLVLFGGMRTKSPYDMTMAADAETYLLDESLTEELTDADKSAKYREYLENTLADDIVQAYPEIKNVEINLPQTEDAAQVEVSLELGDDLGEESLSEIAKVIASALDGSMTEEIVIQDTEGTVLYSRESL